MGPEGPSAAKASFVRGMLVSVPVPPEPPLPSPNNEFRFEGRGHGKRAYEHLAEGHTTARPGEVEGTPGEVHHSVNAGQSWRGSGPKGQDSLRQRPKTYMQRNII